MRFIILKTLICKEVKRFTKIYHQTILAPIVNAMLFFTIFTVAFGHNIDKSYIAVGLIMMSMLQNAFTNAQSSISMSKILGYIVDYVLAPVRKSDIIISLVVASILRSVITGICVTLSLLCFVTINIHSIWYLIYFTLISCTIFALFGIIIGCIASNFDAAHAYTSYVITPLVFLSGTFYSINALPKVWQIIIHFNPVLYMIDGFRYSLSSNSDINIIFSTIVLMLCFIIILIIAIFVVRKQYKSILV